MQSPGVYFHLRARQLENQCRHGARGLRLWRSPNDVTTQPCTLLASRGIQPLSVSVPVACTNVPLTATSVLPLGSITVMLRQPSRSSGSTFAKSCSGGSSGATQGNSSGLSSPVAMVVDQSRGVQVQQKQISQQAQEQQQLPVIPLLIPSPFEVTPTTAAGFRKEGHVHRPVQPMYRTLSGTRRALHEMPPGITTLTSTAAGRIVTGSPSRFATEAKRSRTGSYLGYSGFGTADQQTQQQQQEFMGMTPRPYQNIRVKPATSLPLNGAPLTPVYQGFVMQGQTQTNQTINNPYGLIARTYSYRPATVGATTDRPLHTIVPFLGPASTTSPAITPRMMASLGSSSPAGPSERAASAASNGSQQSFTMGSATMSGSGSEATPSAAKAGGETGSMCSGVSVLPQYQTSPPSCVIGTGTALVQTWSAPVPLVTLNNQNSSNTNRPYGGSKIGIGGNQGSIGGLAVSYMQNQNQGQGEGQGQQQQGFYSMSVPATGYLVLQGSVVHSDPVLQQYYQRQYVIKTEQAFACHQVSCAYNDVMPIAEKERITSIVILTPFFKSGNVGVLICRLLI